MVAFSGQSTNNIKYFLNRSQTHWKAAQMPASPPPMLYNDRLLLTIGDALEFNSKRGQFHALSSWSFAIEGAGAGFSTHGRSVETRKHALAKYSQGGGAKKFCLHKSNSSLISYNFH